MDFNENFLYKTSFSSYIRPLVSEERDKYLSSASIKEIKKFIPDLPDSEIDLLPFAAPGFNINRANKNDDGIDTKTALELYKGFVNRFLDIEHSRLRIIGVILNANLTDFSNTEQLTEEQVENYDKPFNVVLGGVIWRIINPKLADLIEESNDPQSDYYQKFSLSWELGFKDFNIGILKEGSANIEDAEIITGSKIDELKKYLKCFGGSGVIDGRRIIRMPTGKVYPLGAAITEKPAAFVKGIATASSTSDNFTPEEKHFPATWDKYPNDKNFSLFDHDCFDIQDDTPQSNEDIEQRAKNLFSTLKELKDGKIDTVEFRKKTGIEVLFAKLLTKYFLTDIAHFSKSCVNSNETDMTISKIEDITDDSLKQCKASVIKDFIQNELTKSCKQWEVEKKAKDEAIATAQKTNDETNTKLKGLEDSIAELLDEKRNREKLDTFNSRMSEIDASYNLDEDIKSAIVDEIKSLASDEEFNKWKKKASVIFKGYAKKMSKSEKDSAEQQKEYRETNMNAKKKDGKAKEAKADDEGDSMASNEIAEDNKSLGQDGNDAYKDPGTSDDDEFTNRDGKNHDEHDGENNGEHPNLIGRDNWNKGKKFSAPAGDKKGQDDDGHNAGASVIEDAIDNADKEKVSLANTSTSNMKKQTLKEKYQQAFAMKDFIVNGKSLEVTKK